MAGADATDASCGVLVVGGGVCGLWTLHALRAAGYDAWVLERSTLGDGQTIASQGILHAGAKYRLPGNAIDAAPAVADVQAVWRSALGRHGKGEPVAQHQGEGFSVPDLSGVRVIDRRTILWTRRTLGSVAAGVGAKEMMRSEVRKLARHAWPLGFESAPRGVRVYETSEAVLEPASLLEALRSGVADRVRRGTIEAIDSGPRGVIVTLRGGATILASAVVLCAGAGNEALLDLAGADGAAMMQRRPLHQLVALGTPFAVNGHCLKLDLDKPELTVTTGELDGKRTWYFGGGPAEEGVGRSASEQIDAGRAAVARCLPWVDQSLFEWRVFAIDRAEGRTPGGRRPSEAVAVWAGSSLPVLAVWPTKLVLAPRAAAMVVERLGERGVVTAGSGSEGGAIASLPEPVVADPVW
jgi:glycine/D-amino acid oxidase-like deaminating enzyme